MSLTIQAEPKDVYVLRIGGLLKRSEFGDSETAMGRTIDAGVQPRILAILEEFEGWERSADWNDLHFLLSHANEIAKIAVVGEPRWEQEALAFAGAGFRRAPVKFFPSAKLAEARVWLDGGKRVSP